MQSDRTAPHPTILVADDTAEVRTTLRAALGRFGCAVLEAANGREAVATLHAQPCDVLVTDLAMPECDGLETISRVRADLPGLTIVVLTGEFDESLLRCATLLGADVAFWKPVTASQLMHALANCPGADACAGQGGHVCGAAACRRLQTSSTCASRA